MACSAPSHLVQPICSVGPLAALQVNSGGPHPLPTPPTPLLPSAWLTSPCPHPALQSSPRFSLPPQR